MIKNEKLNKFLELQEVKDIFLGKLDEQVENIFDQVSLKVQLNKAKIHNLDKDKTDQIINALKIRPSLLSALA